MRRRGSDDEDKINARLEIAEKELEQAKVPGFHDKVFVNDDLQETYERLERYIFGEDGMAADEANTENEMVDGKSTTGDEATNGEVNGATDPETIADATPGGENPSAMEIEGPPK